MIIPNIFHRAWPNGSTGGSRNVMVTCLQVWVGVSKKKPTNQLVWIWIHGGPVDPRLKTDSINWCWPLFLSSILISDTQYTVSVSSTTTIDVKNYMIDYFMIIIYLNSTIAKDFLEDRSWEETHDWQDNDQASCNQEFKLFLKPSSILKSHFSYQHLYHNT